MTPSWDGWVLYTAGNGHKYHYNHLTHESRWAVDQRAEDHQAEEHFQQYLRQRATVVDPDELDRADKLDAVEAGNEEDSDEDHIGVLQPSAVVSPYAGVGPMTMPTPTNLEKTPRADGLADRLSNALRMAMAKVERPHQDGEGESNGVVTSEWDLELGQPTSGRRERERWGQGCAAGGDRGDMSSSSSESSSSESSSSESSESSSTSDSSSDSDSSARTGSGYARRRSGAPRKTRRRSSRSRNEEAEEPNPQVPKDDRTGRRSVVNLRSSSARRKLKSSKPRRARRRSRTQRSSRRHYSRRRKVDAKRRSEAYSARENRRVNQAAAVDGLADLGRQAVASVAKIAFRAVLGSWKGVTTAAIKAIRTLQVNADKRSPGLPMVVTNSPHKESPKAPQVCQLDGEHWGGDQRQEDRAPYRSFVPKKAAPSPSPQQQQRRFHAGGRFTGEVGENTCAWAERTRGRGAERAVAGGQAAEGLCERGRDPTSSAGSWDEGEGEYSVTLLDRGTEERKGGLTSPPPSWRNKASV